jgi:hypothetical protein
VRVAWKNLENTGSTPLWAARIGPCTIILRELTWYDQDAQTYRDAIIHSLAWSYRVLAHNDDLTQHDLAEGVFAVERRKYEGGLKQAQDHAVELARELDVCKRAKIKHDALSDEAVEWLEAKLIEILERSYGYWRSTGRGHGYPEPQWTTGLLAGEVKQHHLMDELREQNEKRFYALVRGALDRLKRRGAVAISTGVVDGREVPLWEPV